MPIFRIYVENSTTRIAAKDFVAESLEEAKEQADKELWHEENGWEEADGYFTADIRSDLCHSVESTTKEKEKHFLRKQIINLIANEPGIDAEDIANQLHIDVWTITEIVHELMEKFVIGIDNNNDTKLEETS